MLNKEEKIEVLLIIEEMLFNLANSFNNDKFKPAVVKLHQSRNQVLAAAGDLEQVQ